MQVTPYRGRASNQNLTPSTSFLYGAEQTTQLAQHFWGKSRSVQNSSWKINNTTIKLFNPLSSICSFFVCVHGYFGFCRPTLSVYSCLNGYNQPTISLPLCISFYQLELPSSSAAMWFVMSSAMTECFSHTQKQKCDPDNTRLQLRLTDINSPFYALPVNKNDICQTHGADLSSHLSGHSDETSSWHLISFILTIHSSQQPLPALNCITVSPFQSIWFKKKKKKKAFSFHHTHLLTLLIVTRWKQRLNL